MAKWLKMLVWGKETWDQPEYAVVELTAELASYIQGLCEEVKRLENQEVYKVAAFEYSPSIYPFPEEDVKDTVYDDAWSITDEPLANPERIRIDYSILEVTSSEFHWVIMPKHWEDEYSTQYVPVSELDKVHLQ